MVNHTSSQSHHPAAVSRRKKPKSLQDLVALVRVWLRKLWQFLWSPPKCWMFARPLLLFEALLCIFIIHRISYTEIDWEAYMSEVEGYLNGTTDYSRLEGGTGPLVYPAGFVYVYSLLYKITDKGKDIRLAQYIFAALYVGTLALIFRLYARTVRIPPYVLILMCLLSYRIHSIFVLRLFNDCIAMFLLYAAVNLFIDNWWMVGCLLFSAAVSVKMNILLFAPGLLFLLCQQGLITTFCGLAVCGLLQLFLAVPFLRTNPWAYIERSFDLRRQFFYKWTVNWRFLEEELFLDRTFHVALLAAHLALLALLAWKLWRPMRRDVTRKDPVGVSAKMLILFSSNFVGVVCSRSLHYQFYVWYFHTLHFLLWSLPITHSATPARILLLGLIEMAWNTYPSTVLSSLALLGSHLTILLYIFQIPRPTTVRFKAG
ncbi:lethal(2)neighbour of Tid protein-like [Paramacrobiotus metropolitanus]|uniref:lethal(2)neighbour of Tid protein-like n=1 Tax=Paramacrobiotus metropolitanus TaxID=2943436 RepID=UPI0024456F9E|nr:lethal(2)neighbour of Tid protein-like [Paramacrobiotus metropolitanus]